MKVMLLKDKNSTTAFPRNSEYVAIIEDDGSEDGGKCIALIRYYEKALLFCAAAGYTITTNEF
jgi:hypothetical protein